MEQNNLHSNSSKSNFRPELLEDSDFDNINFKAITEGLGFHHGEEKVQKGSLKSSQMPKPKAKAAPVAKKTINQNTESKPFMNGLEAFYNEAPTQEIKKNIEKPKKKVKVIRKQINANSAERVFAFIADLFIITAFMSLTFGIIFITSGIEFDLIFRLLSRDELVSYSAILFVLNYLLYFTILDIKASPGKLLVGIKVVNKKGKSISAFRSFVRALFTLISIPTLILILVDAQDSFSSSKVINSEKA